MELFKIGGKDFTRHIVAPSYTVNQQDVYTEWEDANFVKHHVVTRKRISGNFTMLFVDKNEFFTFLDTLQNTKNVEGYNPAIMYVNNLHIVKNADFYISISPANTLPFFGVKQYDGFDVTIEER